MIVQNSIILPSRFRWSLCFMIVSLKVVKQHCRIGILTVHISAYCLPLVPFPPEMKGIPKILLIGVNICTVFQKKRFIFKRWYILTVLLFVYYLFKCSTHVWVSAILSFCGHHSFSLLKENHEIISGFGWHLVHILVVCCFQ